MTSAPSAPAEPTLADKVKAIEDQIEEAHMTFNDALVTELQAEKSDLEAQGVEQQEAKASKPPTVAEIVEGGDPAALRN